LQHRGAVLTAHREAVGELTHPDRAASRHAELRRTISRRPTHMTSLEPIALDAAGRFADWNATRRFLLGSTLKATSS
jgi:hypothetical protein